MATAPKIVPIAAKYSAPPRRKTSDRGYGRVHQKLRAAKLAADPVCECCRDRLATDLHHVDGNPKNTAAENLQAVCEPCHHGRIHRR